MASGKAKNGLSSDVPTVSGTKITNDSTPTWTWTTNSQTSTKIFKVKLDDASVETVPDTTVEFSFTPDTPLADGEHVGYVIEKLNNGSWSKPGSFAITIDTVAPDVPVIKGATTNANVNTPIWSWTSGGAPDSSGIYRYKLDDPDLSTGATTTSDASFTPTTTLADGVHR